jgi:hypothetical protein
MQGEAHLLAGRWDLAQQCVDRALGLADLGEEHGGRAWSLRLAAEVVLAREGLQGADRVAEQYGAALALATKLDMRPLQARCHLGLGKLYRRIDRVEDARVELAIAVTMLRGLGMAFWLPEAIAEQSEAQ